MGLTVEIYCYFIPEVVVSITPFDVGNSIDVNAQVFHAYETKCMETYYNDFGEYPFFSLNSDKSFV